MSLTTRPPCSTTISDAVESNDAQCLREGRQIELLGPCGRVDEVGESDAPADEVDPGRDVHHLERTEASLDVVTQQGVEAARHAVEQHHRLRVRPGQLEARPVVLDRLRHDVHDERGAPTLSATRAAAAPSTRTSWIVTSSPKNSMRGAQHGEDLGVARQE